MVNLLDEWNTDSLRKQVEKQEKEGDYQNAWVVPKKKVRFSISPSCFCIGQVNLLIVRRDIADKIKDLNKRLIEIDEQKNRYNLKPTENTQLLLPERQKTSSSVDITRIFGRENEKDILITKLLSDTREDRMRGGVHIIPIVGMGGMGKTTLAQLAYNDNEVKGYFETRIWVCVSDPFDERKIANAIIGNDTPSSSELDHVMQSMSTSINGKRFLLVLDDVWTEDDEKWEHLKVPLIQSGTPGSRILVTTRKHEVADMMRATSHMINLGDLSDRICLSIFNYMAFSGREVDESKVLYEDIGEEIVRKCKGLPLAAKTLGSLMRNKKTRREWQKVLTSKIWDLEGVEQKVFQPLLLSYYDLAPAVKPCLLYCAIFEKDAELDRDNLIDLWMAQDYLNVKGDNDKRLIGQTYFDNLVARSFFQDFQKDPDSGKVIGCKMHDIVHDFVHFLTKGEFLIMEAEGAFDDSKVVADKVRHLSLTFEPKHPFPNCISSSYNCKNLHTLRVPFSGSTTIASSFISQLKCLWSLNLSHIDDLKELPKEIGDLIHLRHIDLSSNYKLETLPDTICNLCNLYTLRLSNCTALKKLPDNMGKLINLKNLYLLGCNEMRWLPKGIARLTGLQRLDECHVYCDGRDEVLLVWDLKCLNLLEDILRIRFEGYVEVDEVEAVKAHLWDKKNLFHVEFDFQNVDFTQTKCTSDMLNALRPHEDLESLRIGRHTGTTWPNWMTSFHNLRILILYRWNECEVLPPLAKLASLEKLILGYMEKVESVSSVFSETEETETSIKSSSVIFPRLKELTFEYLPKWEEWPWEDMQPDIAIMPCLTSLRLEICPLLKKLPEFLLKAPLQSLHIFRCHKLLERYELEKGFGEEWQEISHIPNIEIYG